MPRAASSWWMPQPTIISLVESSPFHMIMTGVGVPSDEASWKYAGSSASPNGMATFVVAGSLNSKDRTRSSTLRSYSALRPGSLALCIRSACET